MILLPFDSSEDLEAALPQVQTCLAADGVVLVPTETFYGLAADPYSHRAVANVLRLKGRPQHMPFSVLAADWDQVERMAVVSQSWRIRLEAVWPGPITAVFPARVELPAAPGGTVAVRIPGHSMLRKLLFETGPLTGTSANAHGDEPAVEVSDALNSLVGEPGLVLDGGRAPGGQASTLMDLTGTSPKVLRQGAELWIDK